jgi:hypothetical protein
VAEELAGAAEVVGVVAGVERQTRVDALARSD